MADISSPSMALYLRSRRRHPALLPYLLKPDLNSITFVCSSSLASLQPSPESAWLHKFAPNLLGPPFAVAQGAVALLFELFRLTSP